MNNSISNFSAALAVFAMTLFLSLYGAEMNIPVPWVVIVGGVLCYMALLDLTRSKAFMYGAIYASMVGFCGMSAWSLYPVVPDWLWISIGILAIVSFIIMRMVSSRTIDRSMKNGISLSVPVMTALWLIVLLGESPEQAPVYENGGGFAILIALHALAHLMPTILLMIAFINWALWGGRQKKL